MKTKFIYALLFMMGILFPALSGNLNQVSTVACADQDTVRNFSLRNLSSSGSMPEVIPPSPQMASMQTYTDIPVSYATGVPDVSIPLYTLKTGNIEIPIVLRYHTHNVKPHLALSTNVALGWSVEYGGALSRTIVGVPDENLQVVDPAKAYNENSSSDFYDLYLASRHISNDFQSDWFHYTMPTGESGRFFLERKSWTGNFANQYDCWLYPNTESKVDAVTGTYGEFSTFTLTDRHGLTCEYGNGYVEYPSAYYGTTGCSGWMLKKVTDPKTGRSVDYAYTATTYQEAEALENTFTASVSTLYDEDPRCSSPYGGVAYENDMLHAEASHCSDMFEPDITYLDDNCLGAKRNDCITGEVGGYQSWKVNTITDGYTTVTFNYVTEKRLSSIVVVSGGAEVKRITFNTSTGTDNVPTLTSVSMTGKSGSVAQTYSFGYNSAWNGNAPDYWGFSSSAAPYNSYAHTRRHTVTYTKLNGNIQAGYDFIVGGMQGNVASTTLGTHDFSGTSSATSYLLNRITYPTGGYSTLSYETGRYQYSNTYRTGGSPRVKTITDNPATGNSRTRTFTYQTGKTDVLPESEGLYQTAAKQVRGSAPGHTISLKRTFSNVPHFGLSTDVYYPQVDVTHTEGSSSFKETYLYDTSKEHTAGILSLLDQYQRYYVRNFFTNPQKGKLLQRKVYDSSSALKQDEVYTYATNVRHVIDNMLVIAQIEGVDYGTREQIRSYESYAFLDYPVFQYVYYTISLPTSTLARKTTTTYDGSTAVVTTEDYTYATGSDVKLTKKVTSRSDGGSLTEDYTYISSSSTNGSSLMAKNMVGLQETITSTQGGQSESLKYGYTAAGLNDKVWYRQGSDSWQLRSTVEYGSYGNPQAVYGPDNLPTCYVWAYNGRYPLARIEGLDYGGYSSVRTSLQNWLSSTNNTTLSNALNTLRSSCNAKGGHVTGRLYDNATGNVVQESLPSGEVTDYSYDGWGRLTAVKDDNAKTVREHHYSLGNNNNYIITKTMVYHGDIVSSIVKQWFDGLGRALETVDMGAGESGKNLVTLTEYDQAGRTVKQWLPYAVTTDYVAPSTLKSSISSANYGGDSRPYAETQYEASTLGRTLKEYAPGDDWVSHPKTMEYLSNTATGVLACKVYGVSTANALTGGSSYYAAGQLFVTKAADEDGKTVYTFTDKQGQKLLERAVNGSEYLDTYYVYDNYGNLRFVLQPEYQNTANTDLFAFQYKYDTLKRCTWKKLPGASGMTLEYDNSDRLIFSQDGNGKWTWYEYDNLGRLTKQGENTSKAVGSSPYLQNYYDTYGFVGSTGFTDSRFNNDQSGNSYGYLTGTVQEVFGQTTKIYTAYYYDNLGQVTKEVKSNLLGGYDVTETTYTLSGKPSTVTHTHTATGKTTRTEVYTYTYDGKDRLKKVTHKLGTNGSTVTLAEYTYDALGRQSTKKLHGSSTNTLSYSYNIRNWLTGISSTKFTQNLGYGSHYNGNISSMNWNADGDSHSYTFTYDGVNRMLDATHGAGLYTEKVTSYDKNGNVKGLQRYGNGLIDNLTYTYNGNQLTKVEDATGNAAGFSNGASAANEYTYDNNGNLTKDSNKGITNIAYNVLNLPSKVTFTDGSTITYSYAADGTKLRTVHTINGTTTQKDYCSNVVYENGVQKLLLTEEGYVDLSNTSYYYYLKDHQGNNRVVVSSGGTVAETNHYYPFGGVFDSSNNVQPYKYNGKELDTKKGLNWYDYGARHYDAALGRWFVVDPLAEKMLSWSPYAYCFNNPIKFVDEEGKFPLVSNVIGALLGATVEYTGQVVNNIITDGLSLSNFTQVDAGDILVSAGEGFITSGTSAIKNGIAKATIKLGAEVLRNAVDVNNDSSGNFEVSINSAQETIVNTSLGLIGSEIKTSLNVPINTKSVNKTTEAARKTSHNKGQSFSASQAKQVQIKTKQNNAIVKDVKNVVSDNVNGVASNIVVGIIKVDEEKINK